MDWQGELERITKLNNDLSSTFQEFDPNNTHPYSELDFTKAPDGKVTGAQIVLDQTVINAGSSIGQIFGSALGSALGGKDQLTRLASNVVGGTIGSLIGQKFGLVVATSMAADLSKVSLADVFALKNIDITNAGIGAVSSFLSAELGNALQIPGFGGQLFNAAANGFTLSVLTQVKTSIGAGLTFDGAIAAIDWSAAVSGAIDATGLNIGNLLGSYLGQLLVPAKSHEGAIGGQLLGAIGSLIVPGLGTLLGTILGTVIGDLFGNTPHPAAVDLLTQAGDHYGFTHYQTSASDGGAFSVPDQMADPALAIINGYLGAVKGAAFDHFKQVTLGYQTAPSSSYIVGEPGHPAGAVFFMPGFAVQAAALDALQHLEVIGGDLLLKRAHQNSSFYHPPPGPPADPSGDPGPSGAPIQPLAAAQLAILSGDLGVAQDYENYLNNREAINALMAANPDSAFTAGWIATFARVNELKLNQVTTSDFLGGLVGYLDSVNKAGLGPVAANASVKHGSGSSIIVEVRVANGVDVPGSLSVFADQTNQISDAAGKTVQFVFASGLGPVGFHMAASGDAGNALWFGSDSVNNSFDANASASAILIGGAANDTLAGGNGWDFLDGGAGNDVLFGGGGNDILRGGKGADALYGGLGDDTYVFARGDGADVVFDGGGGDTLAFDLGISLADIWVLASGDLIVGVKDPAHPGVPFGQLADRITLQNWADPLSRVENFRFADGTVLNIATALAAYGVPFNETLSRNSVAENSAIGTAVGTVTGVDLDAGAVLHYSFVGDGGPFAIDPSTGVISVAGALNYEATRDWQPVVRVADQAGHVFDKPFLINVTNVNEAPADITLSASSVPENSPAGTVVGTATGIDPDAGTVFTYSLLGDVTGGRFSIDASTGVISVAGALNYEGTPTWPIVVRAADQYGQVFDKGFTIHVTDVNEPTTDITLSASSVPENSLAGTIVGTAAGIDPDADTVFSYSLVGDVTGGRFSINASTGVISVAGALNYEGTPTWPIVVRAADQYGQVFDKPFLINVTDVNEKPTDAWLSFSGLAENSPGGTLAATVAGADPDAGASLRYSLTDDAGGRFFIYPTTGQIVVVNRLLLDYEAASSHHITVRTTDQGGLWFEKSWDIPLTDVNDPTTDITLSGSSVPENSLAGTIVGTAHGIDPDAGTVFSYSLLNDVTGGRFSINASTGALSVAGALNYEGTPAWPIVVRAADQYGLVFDKAFVINVTNVNETPTDITLSGGSVPENSPGGTIIGTAHGIDPDAGTVFTYSLTDDAGGRFFIYPSTGIIVNYSSQSIDYEAASSYHVTVRAADQSGLYVDKILTLNLTNVNEAPTDITLSGGSVPENSPGGTIIGTAHGVDQDAGTVFTYSLADDAGGRFFIYPSTGIIVNYSSQSLDYETASSFHVTVRAADQAGLYVDKTLTLQITDVNDRGIGSDFDGNRHDDILWRRDDGTISVWDNGQISQAHSIAAPGIVTADWTISGKGDFDGNGRDDILWVRDNGTASVWDNGTLSGAHWIAGPGTISNGWHFSGVGDFDGNGHDDILWVRDDGTATVWDNGALSGAHWIAGPGTISNGWHVAGVGDFDGNGHDDILALRDDGTVTVWDNGQLAGAHSIAAPGTITSDWKFAGTGDFDGNGHDDILWRRDNGSVAVWDNGALAAGHWVADPSQVVSGWHIV